MKKLFLMAAMIVAAPQAFADNVVGKILAVKGEVVAYKASGEVRAKLKLSSPIYENDAIRTASGAKAQIMFNDKSLYTVGENAEIVVDKFVFDPSSGDGQSILEVTKGIFKFLTGDIAKKDPEKVKINTPTATIGVRGSGGIVHVEANGMTLLNMTECCVNIGARGQNAPAVNLTDVNTYSQVSTQGEVSQPKPASVEMLMELNQAIDLKGVEKADDLSSDATPKADNKKQEKGNSSLKELVQKKKSEPSQAKKENTPQSAQSQSKPAAKAVPAPAKSLVAMFGAGSQNTTPGVDPSSDVQQGTVVDSAQQQSASEAFGGSNGNLADFGTVQSGQLTRQSAVALPGSKLSEAVNAVLKTDVNRLIVEQQNGEKVSFQAPAQAGKAISFDALPFGRGYTYRGLNDRFYVVSTNFGRDTALRQMVAGERGYGSASSLISQFNGQRLYFNFLPDSFAGKDQFVDFNLANGVNNPKAGSGFTGARAHSGAGMVVDFRDYNNQFVGGHVNISSDPSRQDYSFKFMVGEVESSGSTALSGVAYSAERHGFNPVQLGNGTLQADVNHVYGNGAELDAYQLGLSGFAGGHQTAYAVNTGQADALSNNPADDYTNLKGFSSGLVTLDAGGLSERLVAVKNDGFGNVHMVQNDDSAGGATVDFELTLSKVQANGEASGSPADTLEVGFGSFGANQAYVSHNVYGAEESQSDSSYDNTGGNIGSVAMASGVDGAVLSSYFVDVPENAGVEETCQDCQFLTWGVWAADMQLGAEKAVADFVPYVVGKNYQKWSDVTTHGVTNANYKGIMVGSIADGSSLKHDVGSYTADVNFGTRTVGFDGEFAGYRMSGTQTGVATDASYGFGTVELDTLKNSSGADVGSAYINGVFYGAGAQEMGGSFNFKDGATEAAGIYAGKKQ